MEPSRDFVIGPGQRVRYGEGHAILRENEGVCHKKASEPMADLTPVKRKNSSKMSMHLHRSEIAQLFRIDEAVRPYHNPSPRTLPSLMKILATRIQCELKDGRWPHCAIYEQELQRIWPLNQEDRKAKIAQFATKHGFHLSFYKHGLCAIFVKESLK